MAGLGPDKYPPMSVSIAEEEVKAIGPDYLKVHYAAWNYFQTVNRPTHKGMGLQGRIRFHAPFARACFQLSSCLTVRNSCS